MAATRLSEGQKSELVARFRAGATTAELAQAYGCSPNTVIRSVRAALDPEEYERLKRKRNRGGGSSHEAPSTPAATPRSTPASPPVASTEEDEVEAADDTDEGPSRTLAIDDADDFSSADDEEDLLEEDGDEDESADADVLETFVTVPLAGQVHDRTAIEPTPLQEASLPASAYMLVDKTVELQARPLRDFPELGSLPAEEGGRQALAVYLNPRQAKRQCGRSQRVIKLPDLRVLERTAPYLLAQGISRVVIEGSLYSLPGS